MLRVFGIYTRWAARLSAHIVIPDRLPVLPVPRCRDAHASHYVRLIRARIDTMHTLRRAPSPIAPELPTAFALETFSKVARTWEAHKCIRTKCTFVEEVLDIA